MRKLFYAVMFLLIILGSCPLCPQATAQEVRMKIPTYLTGPDDPSPPLANPNVYPYPLQTDIRQRQSLQEHRVVVLENPYIQALVLPDLGGRLYAGLDKSNRDFDFLYHNHVIKPGLVALRGAWLSGGIEWNFPTLGHTVNTVDPVRFKRIEHADGSVTCVVGADEWVRDMKWEVFITLLADRSLIKTHVRLSNESLLHQNAYFWANAAMHAWPDTRVIFPPADHTYSFKRRNPIPWPVFQGVDVSWYKNTATPFDYFCGVPGDFNGCYNYDHDNGTVHIAYPYDSLGKKFWTWGTAPSGAIWEKLLSDSDGQYIEVQSGRMLTQGDAWIFEPHLVEEWDEYWYPVKGMKGFVQANPDAALNLVVENGKAWVALNVTRRFGNGRLRLQADGREIFSQALSLTPADAFAKELAVPAAAVYVLGFYDAANREVISYSTANKEIPKPETEPDANTFEPPNSAESLFLKGYYAMKDWDIGRAADYWRQALQQDAGFTPALRWLGIAAFRQGLFREALDLFQKALDRNDDDDVCRYYRALCKIELGIQERTEEDLYKIGRRAAFRHLAPYILAGIEIGKGNLVRAAALLQKCLAVNPDDLQARTVLAALWRHQGRNAEALALLDQVLDTDPLHAGALIEKKLQTGDSDLSILRLDPQAYLQVAERYAQMNLVDDAIQTLQFYLGQNHHREYPLVYYHLGHYLGLQNRHEQALSCFKKGSQCSPDYVFPNRSSDEKVLNEAVRIDPADWKAYYYLGNLLSAKLRWQEGLAAFEKAAALTPPFSVLYRNISETVWKKVADLKKAQTYYEKALFFAPEDYRLYLSLDELYARTANLEARRKLLFRAPPAVKSNFNILLQKALFHLDAGDYGQSLAILQSNTFLPWEGWTRAHDIYALSLLNRALLNLRAGKFIPATQDIRTATLYPENLGSGKPARVVETRENWLQGLAYEKAGDFLKASECYRRAAAESADIGAELLLFKALAMKKIGEPQEAEQLLKMNLARLQAQPATAESDTGIALLYAGIGERRKAEEILANVLRSDPANRWAAFYRQLLPFLF